MINTLVEFGTTAKASAVAPCMHTRCLESILTPSARRSTATTGTAAEVWHADAGHADAEHRGGRTRRSLAVAASSGGLHSWPKLLSVAAEGTPISIVTKPLRAVPARRSVPLSSRTWMGSISGRRSCPPTPTAKGRGKRCS